MNFSVERELLLDHKVPSCKMYCEIEIRLHVWIKAVEVGRVDGDDVDAHVEEMSDE